MNHDPDAEVLEKLDAMVRRSTDMMAEQKRIRVYGADDNRTVVVIADGLGHVMDLQISDIAARYPQLLGGRIAVAVERARHVAAEAAEEQRAADYPDLPSLADIQESVPPPPRRGGFEAVDHAGSWDTRNAIAEYIEVRQHVERTAQEFDKHPVRQEIGVSAGTVETNAAGTRLTIEIQPQATRWAGTQRLADQVVDALRLAEERAENSRMSALDRISVGSGSVGDTVRAATHRFDLR